MTDNEIAPASYSASEAVAYFAATQTQADAIAQAIDQHIEEHSSLPAYVVVDRIAFELRWHPRTHPKEQVPGSKRGRPAFEDRGKEAVELIRSYGPRKRRKMYRAIRRAWDLDFVKAGAAWHVRPLSRTQWQRSNRGEHWVYPDPRPLEIL